MEKDQRYILNMLENIFLNIGLTFNQMGEHIEPEKKLNALLNFHLTIKISE